MLKTKERAALPPLPEGRGIRAEKWMSIQARRVGRPKILDTKKDHGATKIAVNLGTSLYDAIEKQANLRGTSFAEQVRRLCKIGLAETEVRP
jgi:hypothetical protein